ncbi:N-acetylglucosamine-6-phosphate deacetylase [Niallia circulans]|jgi:N-acetylglucosamine-6-phosphate deacetylase|uniref:N-acetylglucosamine-6-phosphate deacetylase n=1 Tax=Niallia circulans TaxID=1397 RepID=UPI00077C4D9B|nr:N-acetylglucosamine-6-phosphate deacetylase [Niallia circulans]MDR4316148.1 N-acetylglucosamine-6-phosphate deacetylase [Niallia circulans]MED3837407.1 N-acetylglucosamine-6-phosphate deacetylase [Niallia circulans]MED4244585.1 N-acetylglucosamine-6-phosphate deacetylase [Niallia circulans]MED4249931.1 N-acetylglucosamine-6-phosphate deacetylase [Niallia circulans]PAE13353.1 N-acetylglucosamine-6-phosphate deacetylase [Niallia circulans]
MLKEETKALILKNVRIYTETEIHSNGYVVVKEGKIDAIGLMDSFLEKEWENAHILDFPKGMNLIPGFIDIHIHGANNADAMDASQQALEIMAETLPKEGTTSFLATTMTQEVESIENALTSIAQYVETADQSGKAEIIGIHLEGPFISEKRVGAQPVQSVKKPNVELFKKWQTLSNNQIKLVTMAPEEDENFELVRYLKAENIVPSIGHSDAVYEQVLSSIQAGVNHVTHLFNGMRGLHHRDPGVAGAALLHSELMAEMIVDGVHIHPEIVKLAFLQKGADHIILITDSMRAKWLEDGISSLGGQKVIVRDGKALLENGALAGSTLKMKDAINNMMNFTGCSLQDVVKMASYNPAKQIGVLDKKGSIAKGKDADLVVLDENNQVALTICKGKIVYSNGGFSA